MNLGLDDVHEAGEKTEPVRVLLSIAAAQLLALTLWFSATAVAPSLRAEWGLSLSDVGALTMAVQLGFVVGALGIALLNLADLLPSRHLFAACATLGALANASIMMLEGEHFTLVLALRFATGMTLAGVYPSGLKVMAGWFRRGRGMAMGTLVGALTVGSATPHLVRGLGLAWQSVLIASSCMALLAAAVMLRVGDGPHETRGGAFSWKLIATIFCNRGFRLTTLGYLGHMWELYAMWAWLAAWLGASALAAGSSDTSNIPFVAFAVIASGGVGSWAAGVWADRASRPKVAGVSMAVSGACALLSPLLFGASLWLSLPVLLLWGVSVVADSAQFSAMVTEVVDDGVRGTALTLQTALGFLLTLVSIRLVSELSQLWGWQYALSVLALGPALGVVAMARLARAQR